MPRNQCFQKSVDHFSASANLGDRDKQRDLRSGEDRGHGGRSGGSDNVSVSGGHGGECRSTGGEKGGGEVELHLEYSCFSFCMENEIEIVRW